MKSSRVISLVAVLASAVVAVASAVLLAAFFEGDSCVDAGGQYAVASGACIFQQQTEYVAQLARRGISGFWALFLALVTLPTWCTYQLVQSVGKWLSAQLGIQADAASPRRLT